MVTHWLPVCKKISAVFGREFRMRPVCLTFPLSYLVKYHLGTYPNHNKEHSRNVFCFPAKKSKRWNFLANSCSYTNLEISVILETEVENRSRQTDRQADRRTDGQTDRQADKQTYRQTDRSLMEETAGEMFWLCSHIYRTIYSSFSKTYMNGNIGISCFVM